MTSALSPRDIQTRIRSGESLEDVARDAGVPVDKVEPFAAPVLAEREHVAGTALQSPVRRRGETGSVRAMRAVATERLQPLGLDVEQDVTWDAWRNEDRRWTLVGRWSIDDEQTEARFTFDPRARFSVAANDDARWLIGEATASPQAAHRPPSDTDAEPTIDLNDELALVRAVQGSVPLVEVPQTAAHQSEPQEQDPQGGDPQEAAAPQSQPVARVVETEDVTDYQEPELEQVDGVYDFVPGSTSDMDTLYEMLSAFNEDSVNIYAGLADPVAPADPASEPRVIDPQTDPGVAELDWVEADEAEEPPTPVDEDEPIAPLTPDSPDSPDSTGSSDSPESPDSPASPASPASPVEPEPAVVEDLAVEDVALEPVDEELDDMVVEDLAVEEQVAITGERADSLPEQDALPENTEALDRAGLPQAVTEPELVVEPEPAEVPSSTDRPAASDPRAVARAAAAAEQAELAPAAEPAAAPDPVVEPDPGAEQPAAAMPEQDALVDSPEHAAKPKAKPRSRKKRASVPSWDEIMFGGPAPTKD